jgi:4-hydroxy-tetrahydrodipicolinate reductase
MTIQLAIHGAAGRMGKRLIALGSQDKAFQITAAVDSPTHPDLGKDAGMLAGVSPIQVALTGTWPENVQLAIDFSVPAGCQSAIHHCLEKRLPLVVATTGLEPHHVELIRTAAKQIPICWAPSMSLTVNLTMKLVQQAAAALKNQQPDVEIIERHHRFKEDSPSGTALKFGEIVANAMGLTEHVHGRQGQCGARPRNEIGYHAVRVGDDPGQHTIIFGLLGETIEMRVAASNRDCYAQGALAAAKFLVSKPAGLYNMFDVLGLAD